MRRMVAVSSLPNLDSEMKYLLIMMYSVRYLDIDIYVDIKKNNFQFFDYSRKYLLKIQNSHISLPIKININNT